MVRIPDLIPVKPNILIDLVSILILNKIKMKKIKLIAIVFVLSLIIFGCSKDDDVQVPNTEVNTELDQLLKKEDQLEANKLLVKNFYQEFFGDLNIESIHKYIGDVYIQHNPNLADGKQALIDGATGWFKFATPHTIDIQKLMADGDLVFIHTRQSNGTVSVMDVFRIKDGLIVEHWDVIQSVPANSANDHPMF